MKTKGQSAMEYLMTYGWAILVVVAVVAALYGLGVFRISAGVTCSPCFSYFAYVDYANGILALRNGANEINITNFGNGTTGQFNYDPGESLTITGISTSGEQAITVTYTVLASGLSHTDRATIRQ